MSIFEKASRLKLRFESDRGELTVEQLWDVPLTHKSGFSLDAMAIATNREIKTLSEESFVKANPDPRHGLQELRLEILKHIIGVRMAETEAAKQAANIAARRQKLMAALDNKEGEELSNMSAEDIRKELDSLK